GFTLQCGSRIGSCPQLSRPYPPVCHETVTDRRRGQWVMRWIMRTSGYAVNGFANHTLPYNHTLSLQRCPTLPYLTIANSQLRPAPECIAQKLARFIIDNSVHDRAFVVAVLHAYPQRQCDGSRSRKEFNPEEIALAICRRRLLAARRFA